MKKIIKRMLSAVAFVVGLTLASGVAQAAGERFILVGHTPDSDSWWNTIKNAIREAGDHLGVTY